MGAGSSCLESKVIENQNRNREEEEPNYDREPYISNERVDDNDNIHVRKIIYGLNNENNRKMYDAIFRCESINKLYQNKWTYTLYNRFVERIQRRDDEKKFCTICLIGETNKGKTFLLNLLTNNELQSGIEYKTIGISCKFTNFEYETNEEDYNNEKETKFLIFDSAGRSEPLLIDPKEKAELTDEKLKNRVEADNKDLKISEDFIKNFLISHSRIIIKK